MNRWGVGLLLALTIGLSRAYADGPLSFYSVLPCRIIDTRSSGGPMMHAEVRNFQIGGLCGIPTTAKMAAFNFTVVGPTASGNIDAFPAGTPVPTSSTVNFTVGQSALANGSLMGLTPNQTYNLSVLAVVPGGQLDLIIDVTGYLQ